MTENQRQHSELVQDFARQYGQTESEVGQTLMSTVIPGGRATIPQVHALLVVARELGLNPFAKEIYAFPGKGGSIQPVVGLDGWLKLANNHPQFDGYDLEFGGDEGDRWCKISVYRKDRKHPVVHTEWLSECKRNTEPWRQMERRMLGNRATCQGLRRAFSFSGIMDPDEAAQAQEFREAEESIEVEATVKQSTEERMDALAEGLTSKQEDAITEELESLEDEGFGDFTEEERIAADKALLEEQQDA